MSNAPKMLSVIVPCYNESENLAELYRRLTLVCHKAVGDDYEVILINDGSKDATWPCIAVLAEQDGHVVAVNLARNYGHQIALSAGLSLCSGQRVLILDADLQDPPELLEPLIALMDKGADVVYGQRQARQGESWFKRTSALLFYRLLNQLVDVPIPQDTGDFRLMSRRAVDALKRMPERSRFIRGMVSWIGLKQVPFPYERQPRFAGATSYSLRRMIHLALDAITGFSTRPLRLASYMGGIMGIVGFVALIYVLWAWMMGETIQGWTSMMVIMLVLGSAQLLSLGVFGEYLGRLYMEVKQRPLFEVDEVISKNVRAHPQPLPQER